MTSKINLKRAMNLVLAYHNSQFKPVKFRHGKIKADEETMDLAERILSAIYSDTPKRHTIPYQPPIEEIDSWQND